MSVTKGATTTIAYGNAATHGDSSSWTDFAGVTEVTPPTFEADEIETSNMNSVEQWKEFVSGWADAGELEVTLQYDKDATEDIFALFREDRGFRITFSDGSTWEFSGFIKSYGDEIDREGIVTTQVSMKLSGIPEFTKAASQA
jgi:hypothetical protein